MRISRVARGLLRAVLPAAGALAAGAYGLEAQANLSTQGFGFPTGQLSARANSTGGALAEMDPLSPVNPASISLIGSRLLFFQIEPEYRSVTTPNGTEHTSVARYPDVFGAIPIGSRFMVSLGSSTLLDRTSTTSFDSQQQITPTDNVAMTTTYRVDGAMNDLRLAAAWAPVRWLRFGVGVHGITGHNLVTVTQQFADSETYAPFSENRVLDFDGSAVSAGLQLISKRWVAALSARVGGDLNLAVEDTALGRARVPDRFGGSLAYTGLKGTTFSVRTSHDAWSKMGGLGDPSLKGVDAWDTGLGAEAPGPRVFNHPITVRAGIRHRTLPFQAEGHDVNETSFAGGIGSAFGGGRVLTDFGLIRANRSASGFDASEHAWTLSLGFSVRP